MLFLALAWQGALIHASEHGLRFAAPSQAVSAQASPAGGTTADGECPICHALDGAGGYLLSDQTVPSAPAAVAFTTRPETGQARPAARPALGWHSRAPPSIA